MNGTIGVLLAHVVGGDYQGLQLVAALRNVDLCYGGLVAFPFPHSFEVSWLRMSGAGAIRQRPSV